MWIINLFFFLFILIWILAAFFIIYHFIRFGVGRQPKILAFWFLIGSFLILTLVISGF